MPGFRPYDRGASRRPVFPFWVMIGVIFLALLTVSIVVADDPVQSDQIEDVRRRIAGLELDLQNLDRQSESARGERERVGVELDLAEARVEELELVLTETRNEIVALKDEVAALAAELENRKVALATQLELVAILGRPGPLQLLWDGARGGDLEDVFGVVVALAAGQAKIVEEFHRLRTQRAGRLAQLSLILDRAGEEARALIKRRQELDSVRSEADTRLAALDKKRRSTGDRLAELRERQESLERLFGIVGQKRRFTGKEDIRKFRGALPWPAEGRIIQTFGKHFLPRYATYTVCNGLRFEVERGSAVGCVFPGQVAYARHFKGYGNMVVVDHGEDVFSLVAGLGSIQARLNQQVDMGSRLGIAGPGTEDGNLYLEIRVKGKPEDPRRWLQLTEGK